MPVVGTAGAGAGVPAAKPVELVPLAMYTCGRVTWVLMTLVVTQLPGAMEPGAWICPSPICVTAAAPLGHGRVTVVEMETVVTGTTGAGGAGVAAGPAGEGATGGCCGEFGEEAGGAPDGAGVGCCGELGELGALPAGGAGVGWIGEFGELGAWLGGGVGRSVIVEGTFVTIPGFCGMWGAQMPARYASAFCSWPAPLAQALIHCCTFVVKVESLQKQSESALSLHLVRVNQVLRQLGRTPGADGAGGGGELGAAGGADDSGAGDEGCAGELGAAGGAEDPGGGDGCAGELGTDAGDEGGGGAQCVQTVETEV